VKHIYEVIIIGAGQSGIVMSQQLKSSGIKNHIILDAQKRIGDSWRLRYKSLVLFTPKSYSALPGLEMRGDPNSYPTKDEMADYLENYVVHFNLPHKMNTVVTKIEKENHYFNVFTVKEKFQSKKVIIASGSFQKSYIPSVIKNKTAISHVHSSAYTEPKDLNDGTVLVVGGGNSGAQIAVELAEDRKVVLAISHRLNYLPLQIFGKSIFYWLEKLQLLYAGTDTIKGRLFQKRHDPIFGKELKQAIKMQKIKIKPRVKAVNANEVIFSDGSSLKVNQIIWATGFEPFYEIINIDGTIDKEGRPIHHRGVSPVNGLYYMGLPWQHSRGSALICGVGRDAEYLINKFYLND